MGYRQEDWEADERDRLKQERRNYALLQSATMIFMLGSKNVDGSIEKAKEILARIEKLAEEDS